MNADRPFDDAALDRLDTDPENPVEQARFARHVVERDPENVWALMILANDAETSVERTVLLREAVRVGARGWQPELCGLRPAPDWAQDRDAAPFLGSVLAYGKALRDSGHRAEAAMCFRFLTGLDETDRFGAREALAELGGRPAATRGLVP